MSNKSSKNTRKTGGRQLEKRAQKRKSKTYNPEKWNFCEFKGGFPEGYQTGYKTIVDWLSTREDPISEIELNHGSNDIRRMHVILVVRDYLESAKKSHREPDLEELKRHLQRVAVREFMVAKGMACGESNSAIPENIREELAQAAEEFYYGYQTAPDEITDSDEEISRRAEKNLNEQRRKSLREGTAPERNARREMARLAILENLRLSKKERKKQCQLARELGICRHTMAKFCSKIENLIRYGIEVTENALDEGRRGRKPNRFSKISKRNLAGLLKALQKFPSEYDLNYSTWSEGAIQEYLEKYCNIDVTRTYVYKILSKFNIVSLAASRMNPKADSEEIAKFKAGLFAKFKTAIINDEEILFLDETHVQQGNKNYGYAPQGEKAIYETNGGTLHCHYSLLSIIGFNFVMIIKVKGTVTSEIYKKALIKLRRIYPKRKFLIFRDNAVIHRSKEINKYIKGSAGKFLRFEPLPRYCPEFNPVDLLNNEYKKFILKAVCRTEEDVLVMTKEFLGQFQNKKGKSSNSGRRKARQYFKGKNTKFIYNAQIEAMKAVMREKRLKRALQRKVA